MTNAIYRDQPLGVNLKFTDQDGADVDITGGAITVDYWTPNDKGQPEPSGTWEDGIAGITITVVDGPAGEARMEIPENTLNEIGNWTDQPRAGLAGKNWPGTADLILVLEKGKVPA